MATLEKRLQTQQEKIQKETERLNQLKAQQQKKDQAKKYLEKKKERTALSHLKHTLGGMVYKMGLSSLDEALLLGFFNQVHQAASASSSEKLEAVRNIGRGFIENKAEKIKGKTLSPVVFQK